MDGVDEHGWSSPGDARPASRGTDGNDTAATGTADAHLRRKLLGDGDRHSAHL